MCRRKSFSVQRASFAILRSVPMGNVWESWEKATGTTRPSAWVNDVMASCDAVEEESVLEKGFGESASGDAPLQTVTTTAEDSIC